MTDFSPFPACNTRISHRRLPRQFHASNAYPVTLDPHHLEAMAAAVDPTPVLDVLLDMLDDPDTPPTIAATIRDWLDS